MSDVLETGWSEGDRIAVHIEISLSQLDPPEGVALRVPRRDDGPMGEPQAFVGWLGLFSVLQSLIAEQVDRPPP